MTVITATRSRTGSGSRTRRHPRYIIASNFYSTVEDSMTITNSILPYRLLILFPRKSTYAPFPIHGSARKLLRQSPFNTSSDQTLKVYILICWISNHYLSLRYKTQR